MKGRFHLTSSLADDFLHDRLSERDQSALTLHLEECEDCRRLILSFIAGAEHLVGAHSADEKLRHYREWMQGSEAKIAGDKNVLWP
jgi:hypothetical protein